MEKSGKREKWGRNQYFSTEWMDELRKTPRGKEEVSEKAAIPTNRINRDAFMGMETGQKRKNAHEGCLPQGFRGQARLREAS